MVTLRYVPDLVRDRPEAHGLTQGYDVQSDISDSVFCSLALNTDGWRVFVYIDILALGPLEEALLKAVLHGSHVSGTAQVRGQVQ